MTQAHKTVGNLVIFKDKVFHPPYTPYYDLYKDKIYEVMNSSGKDQHVMIREYKVKNAPIFGIHDDEIKSYKK